MSQEQDLSSFATLVHLIARLRAPDGCPWDRSQTHLSLKPYLLEEAYEVLQALERGDAPKLCEELGDLLMQVVLHAQIASEQGEFDMGGVIKGISQKLLRRHPHVFGTARVADAQEVALGWEDLKQGERGLGQSLLSGLPTEMPALAYSQALQRRAAQVGFDWADFRGLLGKLAEEVGEIERAESQERRAEEFGDLLFALADAARWLKVDLEGALRLANERFRRRFSYMEEASRKRGVPFHTLSFEEQNALWEEAKRALSEKRP